MDQGKDRLFPSSGDKKRKENTNDLDPVVGWYNLDLGVGDDPGRQIGG
jgi:hypothetical protein